MSRKTGSAFHETCFSCGSANPDGLGLVFEHIAGVIRGRTRLDARFQSYEGLAHGGILAAIADSAMINLVHREYGGQPLTGTLSLKYRASVRIGDDMTIEARIIRRRFKTVWAACEIRVGECVCVIAEAAFRRDE